MSSTKEVPGEPTVDGLMKLVNDFGVAMLSFGKIKAFEAVKAYAERLAAIKADRELRAGAEPLDFEAWWAQQGQFCRAGGGDYEKTFAFRAWEFVLAAPRVAGVGDPVPMPKAAELFARFFNCIPVATLRDDVPADMQKQIGSFMFAQGYRMVFNRWHLQEPPAKVADNDVSREDFDKMSSDLTHAKNLLVRLHSKHPEARGQIEGNTRDWFAWGVDGFVKERRVASKEPIYQLGASLADSTLHVVVIRYDGEIATVVLSQGIPLKDIRAGDVSVVAGPRSAGVGKPVAWCNPREFERMLEAGHVIPVSPGPDAFWTKPLYASPGVADMPSEVTPDWYHPKFGVHLSHCNFGENVGTCKYGDDDCPSLHGWRWFGDMLERSVDDGVKEDAERYRRLRRCNWYDSPIVVARSSDIKLGGESFSGDRLDVVVDAKLGTTSPSGPDAATGSQD